MYLVDTGFAKSDQQRVERGWATVQRNVARIQSMVSDILYYAKDRVPNWEPLSAAEVAEEVCGLAASRARDHNVQLTTDLDPAAGQFEADAQAVRSMLVNLIENSLDACRLDEKKPDHQVTVRLTVVTRAVYTIPLPDHQHRTAWRRPAGGMGKWGRRSLPVRWPYPVHAQAGHNAASSAGTGGQATSGTRRRRWKRLE